MKRLKRILFSASILCSSMLFFHNAKIEVQAKEEYNLYPMSCNAFEVDRITNGGKFENVGCFNDIQSAKAKMYEVGVNGVVRHSSSYSPTKIIMMYSGVVYSYPQRVSKNTSNIRQFPEARPNMKTTYVTVHREMAYNGTWTFNSADGDGQIGVYLNGFDGFVNLKEVDLIPTIFIQNHLPIYLGGNSTYGDPHYKFYNEQPFLTYVYQGHYEVIQNGNYRDLVYISHSGWADPNNPSHEPAEWRFVIGPAASWMELGAKYYSKDGSSFYRDPHYSDPVGIYYSYYQFLPLRSKSNISVSSYNGFLQSKGYSTNSKLWNMGQVFIDAQNAYGVNATAVYAMACLESAYGTSDYAVRRNNLFGWNAFDSDPNQASYFSSIEQAVREHMGINLRGYLDINDIRYFGGHLGNKGSGLNVKYAGDSYWGMKIAAIAYEIDKFNNSYDGKLTDYNSTTLANITNDERVNILNAPNGSLLYNSAYGATYQKNHIVSVLEDNNGWYKIQSTNILENGSLKPVNSRVGLLNYDWNSNVGWLHKASLTLLNDAILPAPLGDEPTGELVRRLETVKWTNESTLTLEGKNYRPGIYVKDDNQAIQKITLLNMKFNPVKEVSAVTTQVGNDQLNWKVDIDVSDLQVGNYLFQMSTEYSNHTEYNDKYYIVVENGVPQDQLAGNMKLHFESATENSNTLLQLKISEITCGENASYDMNQKSCICNEGFENWKEEQGCTAVVTPKPGENQSNDSDSKQLPEILQTVVKTSYDKQTNQIKVFGIAFFEGLDASVTADIKETLLMVDMKTGEKIELETITKDAANPIEFSDGVDYTRSEYEATIDLTKVQAGNYYFKIKIKNGDSVSEKLVVSKNAKANLEPMEYQKNRVSFYANPRTTFRVEMDIEASSIDHSQYQRAVNAISVYQPLKLEMEKDGILKIDAYGYMPGTYINAENHPKYSILLENENGNIFEYHTTNRSCTFNIAQIRQSKFTMDQACFNASIDLKELPVGTYRMYLDMQTTNESNTWRDFTEMYDFRKSNQLHVSTDNKVYQLESSKVRGRYELTIKEAS